MGVLLILDFYALASRSPTDEGIDAGASFIVNLVDSNFISAHYKDPLTDRHHSCALVDMPNWAYSYALALYRLSQNEDDDEAEKNQELAELPWVVGIFANGGILWGILLPRFSRCLNLDSISVELELINTSRQSKCS